MKARVIMCRGTISTRAYYALEIEDGDLCTTLRLTEFDYCQTLAMLTGADSGDEIPQDHEKMRAYMEGITAKINCED